MAAPGRRLTDGEGAVLAVILRAQPLTVYRVAQLLDRSAIGGASTSKGTLYPLVRRLRARGLIEIARVAGDLRGTGHLVCTERGRTAVRDWAERLAPGDALPEDMLRTKLQSLDLLDREAQLQWLVDAKALLADRLARLEDVGNAPAAAFEELARDNARATLQARMSWLDRVLARVVAGRD